MTSGDRTDRRFVETLERLLALPCATSLAATFADASAIVARALGEDVVVQVVSMDGDDGNGGDDDDHDHDMKAGPMHSLVRLPLLAPAFATSSATSRAGSRAPLPHVREAHLVAASPTPQRFTHDDHRLLEAAARWIAVIAGRTGFLAALEEDMRERVLPVQLRLQMIAHRARLDGRHRDVTDADAAGRALARLLALFDVVDE